MLFSYNADLLPQVRMMGQIRYSEPWLHFSRCINEWVLYVIRDGNLYLQPVTITMSISPTRTWAGWETKPPPWQLWRTSAGKV